MKVFFRDGNLVWALWIFPKSRLFPCFPSRNWGWWRRSNIWIIRPCPCPNNSRHIRQEGVSIVFQRNSSGQTEEESLWRPNPETSWKRFRASHICWLHAHLLLVKFTRIKRKTSTVSSRFWRKMVCSGCTLATAGYRRWWRCHFWRASQFYPKDYPPVIKYGRLGNL